MQWSAIRRRLRSNPCRTDLTLGLCTNCRTKRCDWNRNINYKLSIVNKKKTYTTASCYSDLNGISSRLTHILEVQRLMRRLVFSSVNHQRCSVDGYLEKKLLAHHNITQIYSDCFESFRECLNLYLHTSRPIGIHLPIFVMETLELKFQVWPPHECLVHCRLQLKHVITDSQVVF